MQFLTHLRAAAVLMVLFVPAMGYATTFPTEEDVKGLQRLCGGGTADFASVTIRVDAAIKTWKQAGAGAELEAAKKNLAGALGQVKSDANLAPVYKLYVDCVSDQVQKFMDREDRQPRNLSSSGRSKPLLRTAFVTDEEMQDQGCQEAVEAAQTRLATSCGSGTLLITKTDCPPVSGSPRTYSAVVTAQCRPVR